MRLETKDIVKDIVDTMVINLIITDVIVVGDGTYRVTVCNPEWLFPKYVISLGRDLFEIVSIDYTRNEVIFKEKAVGTTPLVGEYLLPTVTFHHGTVKDVNIERSKINVVSSKFPFIFLQEIIRDTWGARDSSVDRTSELRMFFMTNANFEDWRTEEHFQNAIYPMRNLLDRYMENIDAKPKLQREGYETIDLIRWGTYIADKGFEKRIFNDQLSGIQLDISLTALKGIKICC